MNTTNDWLNAVKEKHGIDSDYSLAKLLKIAPQNVSHYRAGSRALDPFMAAKVAGLLGIDPIKVIASAEAERARNDEKRAFWKQLAAAVVLTASGTIAAPPPASAAPTSHNQISQYKLCPGRRRKKAGFFDGLTLAAADLAAAALGIPGQRIA